MKYGDFSSLVQLGVGLHIGTAILQMYGEIGAQPLARTIGRIKSLVDHKADEHSDLASRLDKLEADYDIFRIKLFNEFKSLIVVCSIAAALNAVTLTVISYLFDDQINDVLSIFVVALSLLPAPVTLGILWATASSEVRPLKERADRLEKDALQASRELR